MRIKAIVKRILLQLKHDKRTIALMILAPMLVLTFMSFFFGGSAYNPKIGIINAPLKFVERLEEKDAIVTRYYEYNALEALKTSWIDAIVNFERGVPHIKMEGSEPMKTRAVLKVIQEALQPSLQTTEPEITYLYGYRDMASFDSFGPIFIGFFVFFFVFLISGIAFLQERNSGTLERLLATPIQRWEIVAGYILGFGIFTILQSGIVAWYSIYVLKLMMAGSFLLVLLVTILTAMTALTIGTFISAFADNEMQMIQFIPVVLVPQVFFSGLFDLSTLPVWLQTVGKFTPLWYVADALKKIMIRGRGWEDISFNVLILVLICIFFMTANVLALKKHRKI